jgi:hypothetical protein
MADQTPSRDELLSELEADRDSCFESGATNNKTDIALTFISVLASLAATVLVSATPYKALTASIAAIPAACTALQKIIDFRGRSFWYFQQAAGLKALAISLKYATTPDLETYAKHRADLEVDGEKRWAGIGSVRNPATKGSSHRRPPV